MLLNGARHTPSNTRSARSFHRDTGREIKIQRYCEVLQRRDTKYYEVATKAPIVNRTGTYGTGRTPKEGASGYT